MQTNKEELPEIELADETLIQKCVLGSTYDPTRDDACLELAKRCREEIDKLPPEQQKGIRDKIIDETSFVNHEDLIDTVKVGDKEFPRIYSDPTLFDPGFDEQQYIQEKKEDKKFGTCSLSLFGMEKQFLEQIEKGFFQTKQNAKKMLDIETLILDKESRITAAGRNTLRILAEYHWDKMADYEKKGIMENMGVTPSILPFETLDDTDQALLMKYMINNRIFESPEFDKACKIWGDLSDSGRFGILRSLGHRYTTPWQSLMDIFDSDVQLTQNIINYMIANKLLELQLIHSPIHPSKIEYEICNEVTNPKIKKDKYQVCSEADLGGTQNFVIKEKIEMVKEIKADTWDDVKRLSMNIIWKMIESNKKREILDKAHVIHEFIDYNAYSEHAQEKIREAIIDNYSKDDIVKMVRPREGVYKWDEVGRLDCWHNFLGLVEYPEAIKNKWVEIQMAFEAGEINEEQATKLLKDLAEMEEMFKVQTREGAASHKFEKPTTYQPIRMRLYGSQRYLNTLLNQSLVEFDLETATNNNSPVMRTISGALDTWEYMQLKQNIIYSPEYIKKIKRLDDISASDIWETLRETSWEYVYDYMKENISEFIETGDINTQYRNLMELLEDDWYDYMDDYTFEVESGINAGTIRERAKGRENIVIIADATISEYEDEWEDLPLPHYLEQINKGYYRDFIQEEVEYILERDDETRWTFIHDIDYVAYMTFERLNEIVEEHISDWDTYILEDLRPHLDLKDARIEYSRLLANIKEIRKIMTELAGEAGTTYSYEPIEGEEIGELLESE